MPQLLTSKDLNVEDFVHQAASQGSTPKTISESHRLIHGNQDKDEELKKETNSTQPDAHSALYDGDKKLTDEELKPLRNGKFECFAWRTSYDFARFYIPYINDGSVKLHPWQIETNVTLSNAKPTSHHPYKFCLCACNGSGKDAFIIALWVAFFACCKVKSRCIITSSSGVQLTSQTETYIRAACQAVNEYHGEEIFKINQRFIYCRLSGSEIRLFATDEEGKAEGYHPIEPGREMCIILNEAKSIEPKIYRALSRCTGYNYWLEVSTPGQPHGDFYKHFNLFPNKRHVSTFDCPHLSDEERESDKIEFGEFSALYRSKHLALFTSIDTNSIIPLEAIDRCRDFSKRGTIKWEYKDVIGKRYGIDLAAGGDETVICEIWGNRITRMHSFREKDTIVTAELLDLKLKEWNVDKNHEHIFADDGGVGRGIIDNLSHRDWNIKRILNQSNASNKKAYINRGAELWYRAKRIIEESCFLLDYEDDLFYSQLSNRYQKQQETQGRIALESKAEAKAHGRPSPDRADAFILALTGLSIDDFLKKDTKTSEKEAATARDHLSGLTGMKTVGEVVQWNEDQKYQQYENEVSAKVKISRPNHSLNSMLNKHLNRRQQYEASFSN